MYTIPSSNKLPPSGTSIVRAYGKEIENILEDISGIDYEFLLRSAPSINNRRVRMYNASFSNSNNANKPFNFVYYKYIFKGPYADFLKDESNIRAYSHTLDNAESISLLGTSHVLLPIASLEDTEGFIFLVYFNFYVDTEIEVIEETYRNLNYYSLLTEDIVTLIARCQVFRQDAQH